jgi:hypothetical protein
VLSQIITQRLAVWENVIVDMAAFRLPVPDKKGTDSQELGGAQLLPLQNVQLLASAKELVRIKAVPAPVDCAVARSR